MAIYYLIKEKLEPVAFEECLKGTVPYIAVLTPDEWLEEKDAFTMGIDMDVKAEIETTKAEVNYDSLTGSFSIPRRSNISGKAHEFAFALDEKGVVFITNGSYVTKSIETLEKTKKWRAPSLERFLYDFMEFTVRSDLKMLQTYEGKLEKIEDRVAEGDMDEVMEQLNDIRGDLLDLRTHYEQYLDLSQEFEENENNFFATENLRYFRLFSDRLERYRNQVMALREYTMQIRDLYQTQSDVKQNKNMAVLTLITTIFFPMSIITSWYGMNFEHMPELAWKWSYPVLAGFCVILIVVEIIVFKKKKWM